jgi:MacB-like periplasmic core domain
MPGVYSLASHRSERVMHSEWLSTLRQDFVFAMRQGRRQPVFTAVALITFALGIGANTAMFSVVRGVLLRPLPYRDPARLAAIWPGRAISNAELLFLQQQSRSLEAVAAFSPGWGIALTGAGDPRQLHAARVSVNFFHTLGLRPALGRDLTPNESERGAWNVAILSHELWQTQFGADSGVIGRVVDMDAQPTRIIGVMPAGFEAFQSGVDAWLPLQIDPSSAFHTGALSLAFGRLAAGATSGTHRSAHGAPQRVSAGGSRARLRDEGRRCTLSACEPRRRTRFPGYGNDRDGSSLWARVSFPQR